MKNYILVREKYVLVRKKYILVREKIRFGQGNARLVFCMNSVFYIALRLVLEHCTWSCGGTIYCSVRVQPEGLEVRLQDRDQVVPGALVSPHQHPVGKHDGPRGAGQCFYTTGHPDHNCFIVSLQVLYVL